MVSKDEIWSQAEENIASRKIREANLKFQRDRKKKRDEIYRRNKNNFNTFAIISQTAILRIEEASEWADIVYRIYCEVWQKQGKAKTREFLTTVVLPAVLRSIDSRISSGQDELERMALNEYYII